MGTRMQRTVRSWTAGLLAIAMMVSLLSPPVAADTMAQAEKVAAAELMAAELIISEIHPNNTGTDDYEFFEVHNVSSRAVTIGADDSGAEYTLQYRYDTGRTFLLEFDTVTLQPGETQVFWYNSGGLAAADFQTFYGIAIAPERISEFTGFDPNGGNFQGMANTGGRGFTVTKKAQSVGESDRIVARAMYGAGDVDNGKGVHYRVPPAATADQPIFANLADPTPGVVDPMQVLAINLPPIIDHVPSGYAVEQQEIRIRASITDADGDTVTAQVYFKNEAAADFLALPLVPTAKDRYEGGIPADQATGTSLSYYIWATDGKQAVTTDTFTIMLASPDSLLAVPELFVTEVHPNNEGSDYYEYFEIYNNSNSPLVVGGPDYSSSEYVLQIRNTASGGVTIINTVPVLVEPGDVQVFWFNNNDLTPEDFIAFYGASSLKPHRITPILNTANLANSGERAVEVVRKVDGKVIASAEYMEVDIQSGRGVDYAVEPNRTALMKLVQKSEPTPGEIRAAQIPAVRKEFDPVNRPPEIRHSPIGAARANEVLEVQAVVSDPEGADLSAVVFYRTDLDSPFAAVGASTVASGASYSAKIPAAAVAGLVLEYYIEASDGGKVWRTPTYTVRIETGDLDMSSMPMLLITEIVPDTTNVDGVDGYEFVEIYNNTDRDLNFDDFKLKYRYPDVGPAGDLLWPGVKEDVVIPSRGTIVLWVIRNQIAHLTADDFNAFYGTHLTENVNLIKMYNDGMHNTAARELLIATNTGEEIARIQYNTLVKDTAPNKAILYGYPVDGTMNQVKISAGVETPTPGTVHPMQVPAEVVKIKDHIRPTVKDLTDVTQVTPEEGATLAFEATDDQLVRTVALYVKSNLDDDYKKVYLTREDNNRYTYRLHLSDLVGRSSISYYVRASDGVTEAVTTEVKTIRVLNPAQEPLRLNVAEGEIVSGTFVLKGAADGAANPSEIRLFINGRAVSPTYLSLEKDAYFTFDVKDVNDYFLNSVAMDGEVLLMMDTAIPSYAKMIVPIDANRLKAGRNTIQIRSGSKAAMIDERPEENKDNFVVRDVHLVLSDGTVLRDPNYLNTRQLIAVNDNNMIVDFHFDIDATKLRAQSYVWDTTKVDDGAYEVQAAFGDKTVTRKVIVDNTAPEIATNMEEGRRYKGTFVIEATAADAIAGVARVTASLDGEEIELPYETSSAVLASGEHTLEITAVDRVGNEATKSIRFTTPAEHPNAPELVAPTGKLSVSSARLRVRVTDPTEDEMDVFFYKGFRYDATDTSSVKSYRNAADHEPPAVMVPDGERPMSEQDVRLLSARDGRYVIDESEAQFPYHRFEVKLDESAKATDQAELVWRGKSLAGRKVGMYAWNVANRNWDLLTYAIAGEEDFELRAMIGLEPYLHADRTVQVLVQDEIPEPDYSYDYSFVWMSDTQYYSESYPHIYFDIVNWIAEHKESQKIKYVIHTGDLVDEVDQEYQWITSSEAMKVLEEADIPYGVLAGNHDVGHREEDYETYWRYYGADRFEDEPTYGGSYDNNRGHYDLISVNGNDYIFVYMGWGIGDKEIAWMNEVLAQYPNRKAVLNFHEYLLVSGNRSPIAQKIHERVVEKNPNVIMVLCGHYHNAAMRATELDDDGDGSPDRIVYEMLADYQGGPEGGSGYIRLLRFNQDENKIYVETYSPYKDDMYFYDPEVEPGKDRFVLDFDLQPTKKQIATDAFHVNLLTDQPIGAARDVPHGGIAEVSWSVAANSQFGWYVKAVDDFGGVRYSEVFRFETGSVPPGGAPGGETPGGGTPGGGTPAGGVPEVTGENGDTILKQRPGGEFEVDEEAAERYFASSESGELVLHVGGTGTFTVYLPVSVLGAEDSPRTFVLNGGQVRLTLPAQALPTLADGQLRIDVEWLAEEDAIAAYGDLLNTGGYRFDGKIVRIRFAHVTDDSEKSIALLEDWIVTEIVFSDTDIASIELSLAGVYHVSGDQIEYMGGRWIEDRLVFRTNHLSDFAVLEYDKAFTDLLGHWSREEVRRLAAKHIVQGVSDRRFAPDRAATRAEFTTILMRAHAWKFGGRTPLQDAPFSDIAPGAYYAEPVSLAHEMGLVTGYRGRFRPDDPITREEAFVVLMRLHRLTGDEASPSSPQAPFADGADVSDWARDAVNAAWHAGFAKGSGGKFYPQRAVTRAEMAAMILRWLND